jgi:hypothetical protein
MLAVFTLILILSLSILITRIATLALMQTGLSRQSAQFQARSAFTGVGYATQEAESIVNHPLRRRIIMLLMLLGNAGIASVIASLMLTFLGSSDQDLPLLWRLVFILLGVALLWLLSNSNAFNQVLNRLINRALRRYTHLPVSDYAGILHLGGEYTINEMFIRPEHWMANCTLEELKLSKEGAYVLGINRQDGSYLGVPGHKTIIRAGDTVIIYGRTPHIRDLMKRQRSPQAKRQHEAQVEAYTYQKIRERALDKLMQKKEASKEV